MVEAGKTFAAAQGEPAATSIQALAGYHPELPKFDACPELVTLFPCIRSSITDSRHDEARIRSGQRRWRVQWAMWTVVCV